jgi:hypothetical protein
MSANDTQVGGTHYHTDGNDLQHWDLATRFRWDPFQYQITKYVMRWKNKHPTHEQRLEDLKKARHFLDKYIENAETWDPRFTEIPKFTDESGPAPELDRAGLPIDRGVASLEEMAFPDQHTADLAGLAHHIAFSPRSEELRSVSISNQLLDEPADGHGFRAEGYFADGLVEWQCCACGAHVRALTAFAAFTTHGNCAPGQGYVKQG